MGQNSIQESFIHHLHGLVVLNSKFYALLQEFRVKLIKMPAFATIAMMARQAMSNNMFVWGGYSGHPYVKPALTFAGKQY